MSIADEITRIKNNIKNAYSECLNKGVTLPENQNSANLSTTISSITSGTSSKYGLTMDSVFGDVDSNGKLLTPLAGNLIANGIEKVDDYILANQIGGNAYGVSKPRGYKNITFPNLKYVGNAAMYQFCTYTTDLETVSFPELEEIGQCGMMNGFTNNNKLRSISFPKLKRLTGMYNSLSSVCNYCRNLEYVNLDSLESLTSASLTSAFYCTKLTNLSFPALNPNSFGSYTDQFGSMLGGVTGCTVHFPYAIEDVIGNWSSVQSGFGGTNTVVLFDLHRSQLNFITDKTSLEISINGKRFSGTSGYTVSGNVSYTCYDRNTNWLYVGNLENVPDDAVVDVNIDSDTPMNKITISTGVSGLNVYFKVNKITLTGQETSNGNYEINTNSNGDEITYFIDGGNNYSDSEGVIISTGQNITINVSVKRATVSPFTRPNLTSNGVLGGNDFAVVGTNSAGSQPYQSMDGTSSYWWASAPSSANDTDIFTFYNPKPIKLASLNITYWSSSTTYVASKITVDGSNDNSTWESLTSVGYVSGQTRNIEVNSKKFYKYHRILFVEYSVYLRITDIGIVGTYKE